MPTLYSLLSGKLVEKLSGKLVSSIVFFTRRYYPEQTERLHQILLRLPALRLLSPSVMEELFFAGLIGNVQIDNIIPYILRMETAEYNSQVGGLGAGNDANMSESEEAVQHVVVAEDVSLNSAVAVPVQPGTTGVVASNNLL